MSKGKFTGLCFRFSDDMVSMDDWKPNFHDPTVMNFCVVSEGTYEVCSKTTSHQQTGNSKILFNYLITNQYLINSQIMLNGF